MDEQEEFFSSNHNRLLDIATWAKYLAWLALAFFVLRAGLKIFNELVTYQYLQTAPGFPTTNYDFWQMARDVPMYYAIQIAPDILSFLLQGAVYYVVLKGISLGLNMIVETDVNYRGKKREASHERQSS